MPFKFVLQDVVVSGVRDVAHTVECSVQGVVLQQDTSIFDDREIGGSATRWAVPEP